MDEEMPGARRPSAASSPDMAGEAPAKTAGQPDYGGHEFAYESHTDLFRCIHCHRYEVSVCNDDGTIDPCTGQPPEGSGPIEVNAW